MTARTVPNLDALDALDSDELVEGYWEGYAGEPEPGDNRSLAFWHGWRSGAVDKGHRKGDREQALLAHLYVARQRARAA